MIDPDLRDQLPPTLPGIEEGEAPELGPELDSAPDFGEAPTDQVRPASAADLQVVANKMIEAAGMAAAMTLPLGTTDEHREQLAQIVMADKMGLMRAGLHLTGATAAVHKLAPALAGDAEGAAAKAPKLHPLLQVGMGLGVMALGVLVSSLNFRAALRATPE